ncbi:MAG: site-specific integrase [Clostridiales bacterium]|nr:site-specific integrase [Clostridiales bacterium]
MIQLKKPKSRVDEPKLKGYTNVGNPACHSGKEVSTDMASPQKTVRGTLVDDRGTWTVRGRVYDPATGKTRQRAKSTGLKTKNHTKRRAEEVMKEILAQWEIEANAVPVVHEPLFGEFVKKWIDRKSFNLRENSVKSYWDFANVHILPYLGHIPIRKMTLQDLQDYYSTKLKALSVNTLRKHHVVISGALLDAVREKVIPVNFADYVEFPKAKKFKGKSYSEDQVASLLDAVEQEGEPIRAGVTLAVCYGLRRSELLGLRWEDIDFEAKTLCVRNTVTKYRDLVIEAEQTKTEHSQRTIDLIESTIPYLLALKQTQEQNGLVLGKVCVWPDGRPVRPDYITARTSRIMAKYGLDHIRVHDLRHTAASMLSKRASLKQVSEFLGHGNISTTGDIYTHLMDDERKATSGIMDDILKSYVFCSEKCSE